MKPFHTPPATLLPPNWEQNYNISRLLSIYTHNIIYELTERISDKKYILKILDKKYFHKKLYQTLSSSGCNFLLLPVDVIEDSQFIYFIYEHCPCLTDLLLVREFSYTELSTLMQDIGNAILFLHENNIAHRDIAPGNIFMEKNGHFLLGDFSSSRFEEKSFLSDSNIITTISCKIKNSGCYRTGNTPFFSPPDYADRQNGYYIDTYGFAMLLFLLLNESKPPNEEDYATLQSFSFSDQTSRNIDSKSVIKNLLLSVLIEKNINTFSNFQIFFYQLKDIFQNTAAENLTFHTTIIKQKNADFFLRTASLNSQQPRGKPQNIKQNTLQNIKQNTQQNIKQNTQQSIKENIPQNIKQNTPQDSGASTQTHTKSKPKIAIFLYGFLFLSILLFSISFYRSLIAKQQTQTNITRSAVPEQSKKIFMNRQNLTSVDFLLKNHSVEILVLSENSIRSVKPLTELSQLVILDLSCNRQLTDIVSLTNLQHLQQLILTDTNVTEEERDILQNALPDCTILY